MHRKVVKNTIEKNSLQKKNVENEMKKKKKTQCNDDDNSNNNSEKINTTQFKL